MVMNIKKLDNVLTADGKRLGLSEAIFQRQQDVDPSLRLYASYLEVKNFDYGSVFYIPTDFVAARDPESGAVTLSTTFSQVLKNAWGRMPDFVAQGRGKRVSLSAR